MGLLIDYQGLRFVKGPEH